MIIRTLLLILLLTSQSLAQDFWPHVKLTVEKSTGIEMFSGAVIKDDEKLRVITCWHALQGFEKVEEVNCSIYSVDKHLSAKYKLQVTKFDSERDIMVLDFPEQPEEKVRYLELAPFTVLSERGYISYGYALSEDMIKNEMTNPNYKEIRTNINEYQCLKLSGKVIHGMSGGAVLYNDKLIGIQSSGSDKEKAVLYCPSDQILEFLK